jgi:hypothetical protein
MCKKTFNRINSFKSHMLLHADENAFQCTQCGKRLSSAAALKNHKSLHTSGEPFPATSATKVSERPDTFNYTCASILDNCHTHAKSVAKDSTVPAV